MLWKNIFQISLQNCFNSVTLFGFLGRKNLLISGHSRCKFRLWLGLDENIVVLFVFLACSEQLASALWIIILLNKPSAGKPKLCSTKQVSSIFSVTASCSRSWSSTLSPDHHTPPTVLTRYYALFLKINFTGLQSFRYCFGYFCNFLESLLLFPLCVDSVSTSSSLQSRSFINSCITLSSKDFVSYVIKW